MSDETGRKIPANELDLQFMITDPAWGKEVTAELNARLSVLDGVEIDPETQQVKGVSKEHLWGLLSYYTRDMRLSNLNIENFLYCQYWLDLAGDCLRSGFIRSFMTGLSRVITVLELAQSKGGFLRRRNNTVTQEHFGNLEPQKKKGLFGGDKKAK